MSQLKLIDCRIWQMPRPTTAKERVYYCIMNNEEITRQEIARKTGLKECTVCARVSELLGEGVIEGYKVPGYNEFLVLSAQNQRQVKNYDKPSDENIA